jgi:hypothetical protein
VSLNELAGGELVAAAPGGDEFRIGQSGALQLAMLLCTTQSVRRR